MQTKDANTFEYEVASKNRFEVWLIHKKIYNRLPRFLKGFYAFIVMGPNQLLVFLAYLILLKPMKYIRKWTSPSAARGMSHYHGLIDWIGGYPFEVAKPEEIFDFFYKKNYRLIKMKTCGGRLGCNEFICP